MIAFAQGRAGAADIANASAYLKSTYARRLQIDSDIFFPLLRDRCLSEDNIDTLIGRLDNTDGVDAPSASAAATLIDNAAADQILTEHDLRLLESTAEKILKRAAITKAALFPIACVRFDNAAMSKLVDALRAVDSDWENPMTNKRGTQ